TATVTGVEYHGVNDAFDMVIPGTVEHDGVSYTVTAIGDKAFGGSTPQGGADFVGSTANESKLKIRSVVIPSSVKTIGEHAFSGGSDSAVNNRLESVTYEDATTSQLQTIGQGAFRSCGNLTEFTFPAGVTTIGTRAFQSSKGNTQLHKLVFLTKDPSLPSSIGTTFTFTGVGFDGQEVEVWGYAEASRVQQLASDNSGSTGTGGTNKGMNFVFHQIEDPQPQGMLGDADGNGEVNSRDALYVIRYATGRLDGSTFDLSVCDVDGSGEVNSRDALYIIRYATGRIDTFPAAQQQG
ncbi:MAG: leucine-rich repeat protein, partial [Coriobacteriales bacterium]|nr:leucine-rich repeat protein [Coriobacteriales bacterium]